MNRSMLCRRCGAGGVGFVGDTELGAAGGEPVGGEDLVDGDAPIGEPGEDPFRRNPMAETLRSSSKISTKRDAAVVIDRDIDVFPALASLDVGAGPAATTDSMTGPHEPAESFGVEVPPGHRAGVVHSGRGAPEAAAEPVQSEAAQHRFDREDQHLGLGGDPPSR
jgi:hypothetical protein